MLMVNKLIENMQHHYQELIDLFNTCFAKPYNTRLVKGGNEPIYLPANETLPYNAIYFANGFFSSALHECAHWFIAGEKRRQLIDFGYWYNPDGRTTEQQSLFEKVEIKPQAIEWILSVAANFNFRVSLDNLNGIAHDNLPFKLAVFKQVKEYIETGLPPRAKIFKTALHQFYHSQPHTQLEQFDISSI